MQENIKNKGFFGLVSRKIWRLRRPSQSCFVHAHVIFNNQNTRFHITMCRLSKFHCQVVLSNSETCTCTILRRKIALTIHGEVFVDCTEIHVSILELSRASTAFIDQRSIDLKYLMSRKENKAILDYSK